MRPSQNGPADREPVPGKLDPEARTGSDRVSRLVEAVASVLAAVEERVGRLEEDVRNLQSRNANRS